jgi:hypothetical protein
MIAEMQRSPAAFRSAERGAKLEEETRRTEEANAD